MKVYVTDQSPSKIINHKREVGLTRTPNIISEGTAKIILYMGFTALILDKKIEHFVSKVLNIKIEQNDNITILKEIDDIIVFVKYVEPEKSNDQPTIEWSVL